MKRIRILLLAILVAASVAACNRRKDNMPNVPPTTFPEITIPDLPDMDPTMDTNIPDPSINSETPTYANGTDPSGVK